MRQGVLRGAVAALVLCLLAPPAGAAEPMATAETSWDDVLLHLMTVERKGSVLTVKWTVESQGTAGQDVGFGFTGRNACYAVDEENGTKYYVLTDKEGNALASGSSDFLGSGTYGISVRLEAGKSRRLWMKLPAPPPEVKEISLFFYNVDPLEGVSITDR